MHDEVLYISVSDGLSYLEQRCMVELMDPFSAGIMLCSSHMSILYVFRSVVGFACFAAGACDGLCHLTKIMDRVETPFGFQPIA